MFIFIFVFMCTLMLMLMFFVLCCVYVVLYCDVLCCAMLWASCQIRKIAVAHAPGMPGTFSPPPRVSDPDMHHGTCVTHVPWCMPGLLTSIFLLKSVAGENVPGIPGACATCNFTYLVRGPCYAMLCYVTLRFVTLCYVSGESQCTHDCWTVRHAIF